MKEKNRGFFGRRTGRTLSPRRKALVNDMLARLCLPDGDDQIVPAALFPDKKQIWMEIGFGDGEHLAALMVLTLEP